MLDEKWKKVAAAAIALLLALAAALGVTAEDEPEPVKPADSQQEVRVDGADPDTRRDDTITLDAGAQRGLERIEDGDTATELQEPLKEPGDQPTPTEGPLAAQETPGCRTAFVANQSSRRGTAVKVIVWHQTVSRENGWTSQNALTAMANRPTSGVSWHYLIGRSRGLCTYSVPLHMKAWTQANANPFSVGIEVEAYGDEGLYVTGAGKDKLLSVTRYIGRRYGIPMRHGRVVNCTPTRSGIVEHSELGACGGGHIDVTLTTSTQTLALIAEAARGSTSSTTPDLSVLTKGERTQATELLFRRRVAARHGGWDNIDPSHLRAAERAKAWLLTRNDELHRLGLSNTNARAARHRVLHAVI